MIENWEENATPLMASDASSHGDGQVSPSPSWLRVAPRSGSRIGADARQQALLLHSGDTEVEGFLLPGHVEAEAVTVTQATPADADNAHERLQHARLFELGCAPDNTGGEAGGGGGGRIASFNRSGVGGQVAEKEQVAAQDPRGVESAAETHELGMEDVAAMAAISRRFWKAAEVRLRQAADSRCW